MPCHMATLCYLYCLYTKSKMNAEFMFNIALHYMFFTLLAILLPDHAGLTQPGEIFNFWVHHYILLLIPIHIIFTKHYNLNSSNAFFYRMAACLGGLFHYNVYVLLGLTSGHNIGYMICPPSKSPFQGKYFRFWHALVLLVMGALCGFILPKIQAQLSPKPKKY